MTASLIDGWRPHLIVSDIDGTLLNSEDRVTPRLREAISRATDAGCEVALATGRPFRWVGMVLDQLPVRPICVTSNGAVLYDSASDSVLSAREISAEAMTGVLEAAEWALRNDGGVAVAVERVGVSSLDDPRDVFVIGPGYLHTWEEQGFGSASRSEVIGLPAVKMILRNDHLTAPQMYAKIAPHIDATEAHVTYSMNEGLIEVAAPGVTKALGVSRLAEIHGVSSDDVVAFGDMPNDIEMLKWVRLGVAMGNANPSVLEAGDMVTATNDEGGVAEVLERWF